MVGRSEPAPLPCGRCGLIRLAVRAKALESSGSSGPRHDDTFVSHIVPSDASKRLPMKRHMTCFGVLLLAGTLFPGGGGANSPSPPASPASSNGGSPANGTDPGNKTNPESNGGGSVATPGRVEETDAAVSLSPGDWSPTDENFAWSGGTAMQSKVIGATATFTFTGSSVRWIGGRNDQGGIALVSVDGGPAKRVDTFARPYEIHTPMITIDGLTAGPHTLTIKVTGEKNPEAHADNQAIVMVDAFDVDPPIVSHLQETDPDVVYSGSWTHDDNAHWSGGGVRSAPDPAFGGARFTTTTGSKVTLTFRGTSITWQSGRSFDHGIALVTLDGGAPTDVDTYGPATKFQEVVFAAAGLADAKHTLTIEATGRKNPASPGTKFVGYKEWGGRFRRPQPRPARPGRRSGDHLYRHLDSPQREPSLERRCVQHNPDRKSTRLNSSHVSE